ncbi:dnaJ homolog dnj-5 isoform X1 [Penaeus vannamei]|uniref:dnaJ homolog dnj-5 isoform X1 n=1 Tax=Penaeus vannamei TaxID=6689 RepID=UPI00387F7907
MMPSSEERWRNGTTAAQGALGHLLERINNDFTPQHDSQHYQPGFVPSASPPWTTAGQSPLTSLGSQMSPLPPAHANLGSQVPPMQIPHSNMGPQMPPLQPPTTSAPGGMPLGSQLSGSASRSYSVSQDLFSELGGGRSPLLRSSSDLGLRVKHYQAAQGVHYSDGRMDGFMDSSMDSIDSMLVGGHESPFFPEVQRGPSSGNSGTPPPPTLQGDPQNLQSSYNQSVGFYPSEHDRMMDEGSVNNITAKLSNFTASLGSWFGPFDPFRSNLTSDQNKGPVVSQASPVAVSRSPVQVTNDVPMASQCSNSSSSGSSGKRNSNVTASQPARTNKPSYSDVLSKNTVQEGKQSGSGTGASSGNSVANSSSGSSGVSSYPQSPSPIPANQPPQSPSPGPITTRPDLQNHNQHGSSAKSKQRNSNSGSSSGNNGGSGGHSSRFLSKGDTHISSSRVGLDDFDLSDIGLSNGRISAYEHYDWGEGMDTLIGNGSMSYRLPASSPTHQSKKSSSKDTKKNTPEKTSSSTHHEGNTARGNDQLNNKVNSNQQKQPPRRTSYINNNLNASTSTTAPPASPTNSSSHHAESSPASSVNACESSTANNNNNDITRSDSNKTKSTQMSKEEKKFEHSASNSSNSNNSNSNSSSNGGRAASRKQVPNNHERFERNRENQSKRGTQRRRKGTSFTHSELVVASWAVVVQWVGLALQAVLWLGTLSADVMVMSSRLSLHLMTVVWARLKETWAWLMLNGRYYWTKWTNVFWNSDKEHIKMSGKENKVSNGLECNISLPTTGEEAMKRLLACKGKDPYNILGVTQDCTDEDIKKYYKRQAFLVHPDKNKQPGAEEAFKILAHAFEIIGEPDRRREYNASLAEVQLEGAWGELASLLTRLQEKLDEAANTIRCTNCNKRHRRTKLTKPIYAARHCAECQIHHAAREGDIWAESTMLGLRWRYFACMEGAVYDISEWAACQSENLKHLQANTHSVQYRIVSGKKNPPSKRNTPEFPSDPDLEEFFNNLCKEKFGKNYTSSSSQSGGQQMPDMRKRKGKKKK